MMTREGQTSDNEDRQKEDAKPKDEDMILSIDESFEDGIEDPIDELLLSEDIIDDSSEQEQRIEEIEMLEALLYLQARPVSRREIAEVLQVDEDEVNELIEMLRDRYFRRDAPYMIQEEEDSYYLRLKDDIVRQLKGVVVRKAIPRPALRILAYIAFYEYVRREIMLQSHLTRAFGKGITEKLDYLQRLGFVQLIPHGRTVEVKTTKQLYHLLGIPEDNKEAMKHYIEMGLKKYILKMATS